MRKNTFFFLFALMLFQSSSFASQFILQKNSGLPITVVGLTFERGAGHDPKGKEGLAQITARLLKEGGVGTLTLASGKKLKERSREEIESILFPMATEIAAITEREQTSFLFGATKETVIEVSEILLQMILSPSFSEKDFNRIKNETIDALEKKWPREDQEEIGKQALEWMMYGESHPYSHTISGKAKSVKSIALEDVKKFYKENYAEESLVVGLTGVISAELENLFKENLKTLPHGPARVALPKPSPGSQKLLIVKGDFRATGIHLGMPTNILRGGKDYPAMYIASLGFGKHRSSMGRLMKNVREIRGLNYGTYSYIEEFPRGGRHLDEQVLVSRSQQAFTLWGRPTPVENGCFLLKQLTYELQQLTAVENGGLTAEEFQKAKNYALGSIPLIGQQSLLKQQGYEIDSHFYGLGNKNFFKWLMQKISSLNRSEVNKTIRRNVDPSRMKIVVVTQDPEAFKAALRQPECKITYPEGITKSAEVQKEDEVISKVKLDISDKDILVKNAEELF